MSTNPQAEKYFQMEEQKKLKELREKHSRDMAEKEKDEQQKLHYMHCPKCGSTMEPVMMEKIEVKVDSREVLGKKVKQLRRQGITPVHVIGHGVESKSLQCDTLELKKVLQAAGHTHLVNLKIGKERKVHPALVREVQVNPVTREVLHVDFYQVQMAEKVKMEVPLLIIGESPLMKQKYLYHQWRSRNQRGYLIPGLLLP